MENRVVGFIIIGIATLIGVVILQFNLALKSIVKVACEHGPACPMWGTIKFQTNVSMVIMIFVAIVGVYLIFFGKDVKIITKIKKVAQQIEPKKITKENYKNIMNGLNKDEKIVLEKVIEAQGTIFQSELVGKTKLTKVKVTRILDKLEGMGHVERKRRGMTNVVILKG